jgi:probable HAF family extracellular repeat protein
MTDLGTLGGCCSEGEAVNASGEVVGFSSTSGGGGFPHAFLYQSGMMQDIGGEYGFGINNAGTAVGGTVVPSSAGGTSHPFIYNKGTTTVLDVAGSAQAINNQGQVVGYAVYSNSHGGVQAFLYQHGVLTNLGLPVNGSFAYSLGTDISENGKFIVGWADTVASPVTTNIAFLDTKGKMIALGTLGGTTSVAWSVNNSGEVVGAAMLPNDPLDHAFLYDNGKMIDLNSLISPSLGIILDSATGINGQGWIAATATIEATGHSEAVLLKPNGRNVPEPSTLGLLGLGIVALALAHSRPRPLSRWQDERRLQPRIFWGAGTIGRLSTSRCRGHAPIANAGLVV